VPLGDVLMLEHPICLLIPAVVGRVLLGRAVLAFDAQWSPTSVSDGA
jgi:hypothetical protein